MAKLKTLLKGGKSEAVVAAVEAAVDTRRPTEVEGWVTRDPAGSTSGRSTAATTSNPTAGARDVMVFVLGGGCWSEHVALQAWAGRATEGGNPQRVVYGATDLLSGQQLLDQLVQLGSMGP